MVPYVIPAATMADGWYMNKLPTDHEPEQGAPDEVVKFLLELGWK